MTLHEAIDFCERMAGGSHVKGADKFEAIAMYLCELEDTRQELAEARQELAVMRLKYKEAEILTEIEKSRDRKKNFMLRVSMLAAGVKQYQVAEELRITKEHFSSLMGNELPEVRQKEILAAIDRLKNKNQGGETEEATE